MTNTAKDDGEIGQFEVVVGFAGSSRTAAEIVEARNRGEAGEKACEGHGVTAIPQEVLPLAE